MSVLISRINDEIAGTLERAGEGLVRVTTDGRGFGSGIVCHPQGLVLTNAHVVGRGPARVTTRDGRELEARVLALDPRTDLAAISVKTEGLRVLELGDSTQVRPGQVVLALGHPWGVAGAATVGVLIGVGHDMPEAPDPSREWLAASLKLRPGNSGGPLVDVHGRVLGINTMMAGPLIGMAVPVHVVKAFLREALV